MTKEHVVHYKISDHLSNERTYLAWIRTAIGIIAFGFVVERFTFFFKRLVPISQDLTGQTVSLPSNSVSAAFGITLIIFGTLLGVFAYISYLANEKHIDRGCSRRYNALLILAVVGLVFFMGLCFVIFIFFS